MPEQGLALTRCPPSPFVLTQLLRLKLAWASDKAKSPHRVSKAMGVGELAVLFHLLLCQGEGIRGCGVFQPEALKWSGCSRHHIRGRCSDKALGTSSLSGILQPGPPERIFCHSHTYASNRNHLGSFFPSQWGIVDRETSHS